nr:MAG TPA: hypothetical protein [Herelleviridae sp.]
MQDSILTQKSRVYVLLNEQNMVTRLEGEYSLPSDLTNWTLIDEGYGDKFSLAQSHYLDKPLYTHEGLYRYKLQNGKIVKRTEAELSADRANIPEPAPTQLDRVEAQVTYTAMVTDTLLEA